jgi:tungstate transport system ATP-binding protein
MALLEIKNFKVERGGAVLLQIPSLVIREGEIFSLIGPNGAGKTTLLQTLACLMKPSAGEICFKGQKIESYSSVFEYRRRLAIVFHEPFLFDTTVFENVASGLKIRRMKKREIQKIVTEQTNRFGISHLHDRSARTLSGGEAQRTSLARAFAIRPEILFLDEPLTNLDPPSRESLTEDLERILRETRTTTIFATHDRVEALRLSDRIAVVHGGRILQTGTPEEVMNHPVDEFVASFVGVKTVLTGKVIRREDGSFLVSVEGKKIEAVGQATVGETVTLYIRPENITLSGPSSQEMTSARNVFPGKISRVVSLGFYQKVELDCGFPLVAYVTHTSMENLSLKEGKEVKASFKATAIHVLRRGEHNLPNAKSQIPSSK